MIERGGKLIAKVVKDRKKTTLLPEILDNVMLNASIMTDELKSYKSLYQYYDHQSVNHSVKEYVRGMVHTNTIEGFWSCLKRTIISTYHWASSKHQQKYLDESVFRYNTKDFLEYDRFNYFFKNLRNRLKYKDLVGEVRYESRFKTVYS